MNLPVMNEGLETIPQLLANIEQVVLSALRGSPPSLPVAHALVEAAHGDVRRHAIAESVLGHAWQHQSRHGQAQAAFTRSARLFNRAQMPREETEALILLGFSFLNSRRPLSALDTWSQALRIARRLNDKLLSARVYLGIGQVYIGFGDDEKALAYNELALEIARRLDDDVLKCEALLNVASDAFRLGRDTYTLQSIAEAEKLLSMGIENKIWSAEIVYYRGLVHTRQQMWLQARAELETAYTLSAANNNLWGKAHAQTALAEVLLALDDPAAGEILRQAHALAEEAGLSVLLRRTREGLVRWHGQRNEFEASMPYFKALTQQENRPAFRLSNKQKRQLEALEVRSRLRQLRQTLC